MIPSRIRARQVLLIAASPIGFGAAFTVLAPSPLPLPLPLPSPLFPDGTRQCTATRGTAAIHRSSCHEPCTPRLPMRRYFRNPRSRSSAAVAASAKPSLEEPDPADSDFGRLTYWDESYARPEPEASSSSSPGDAQVFSWYCGWTDELGPFFEELVPDRDSLVLVPGIGNDAAIRDMFDIGGYQRLMAFDYAPQGVECARAMFGSERLRTIRERVYGPECSGSGSGSSISAGADRKDVFRVCDARDLSGDYASDLFDAVLDKGTFDSIYLSGGKDKDKARSNLSMAIDEMKRVVKEDGIVFSVTAACVDAVRAAFDGDDDWVPLRDGNPHITEDGYASNNVDATMLAWQLKTTGDE